MRATRASLETRKPMVVVVILTQKIGQELPEFTPSGDLKLQNRNVRWGSLKEEDAQVALVHIDEMEQEIKNAYLNSKLPNRPNTNNIDQLCVDLIVNSFEQ